MRVVAIIQDYLSRDKNEEKIKEIITKLKGYESISQIVLSVPECDNTPKNRKFSTDLGCHLFCGNKDDILLRIYETALFFQAGIIIRILGNTLDIDLDLITESLKYYKLGKFDYMNTPFGNIEIVNLDTLKRALPLDRKLSDDVILLNTVKSRTDLFKCGDLFECYKHEIIEKKNYYEQIIIHLKIKNPTLNIEDNVRVVSPQNLIIGRNVEIDSGVFLHCGGMEWSNFKGKIIIGDHSYIGPNSVLFGAGEIEIGNDVLISPNVTISSHQHTYKDIDIPMRRQPVSFKKIIIEDNVWIGSNAVILPGIVLRRGSVIGAGSVVTKDVLPYTVVAGVPAKTIKTITKQKRVR